jgi:hypothetical protein
MPMQGIERIKKGIIHLHMNKAKPGIEQSGGYDARELVLFEVAGRMSCQITQKNNPIL